MNSRNEFRLEFEIRFYLVRRYIWHWFEQIEKEVDNWTMFDFFFLRLLACLYQYSIHQGLKKTNANKVWKGKHSMTITSFINIIL